MFYLLQTGLLEKLKQWDQSFFIKLNSDWTNPVFDSLMPFMRNGMHWAPVYLFFGMLALFNFKRRGAWWILFFITTVALTDLGGNYLFKQNFYRPRPCAEPGLIFQVRLLIDNCTTASSFISNHAANHFGMATFFFITFKPVFKKWAAFAFLWAAMIAYAQVYVGIHYPGDVLTGALFGSLIGLGTGKLFNKRHQFAIFDNQLEA